MCQNIVRYVLTALHRLIFSYQRIAILPVLVEQRDEGRRIPGCAYGLLPWELLETWCSPGTSHGGRVQNRPCVRSAALKSHRPPDNESGGLWKFKT